MGKSSTGMSLGSVLFVIFVVLKLVGVIDWSWWIVSLPILIPIGFAILILIIAVVVKTIRRK